METIVGKFLGDLWSQILHALKKNDGRAAYRDSSEAEEAVKGPPGSTIQLEGFGARKLECC